MARIYVASSWRNERQPAVVAMLRQHGHEVYDFKDPDGDGSGGFHWRDVDPDWENWTPEAYRKFLVSHPVAAKGYLRDMRAMEWADTCVIVLPCGRSAHLEAGWFAGRGKRTLILLEKCEPELMALMLNDICISTDEVLEKLSGAALSPIHASGEAASRDQTSEASNS